MGGGEGGKEKKKINILEVEGDRVPFFFVFLNRSIWDFA